MKQKILRILPFAATALVMLLIFYLSSQTSEKSAELSSGITKKIVDAVMSGASEAAKKEYTRVIHTVVRKCAHFVLYASLGFSAVGIFIGKKNSQMWFSATVLCFIYAISDELHQMTVAGRAPMVRDVFIDVMGGGFGAAVFLIFVLVYEIRKERKND